MRLGSVMGEFVQVEIGQKSVKENKFKINMDLCSNQSRVN